MAVHASLLFPSFKILQRYKLCAFAFELIKKQRFLLSRCGIGDTESHSRFSKISSSTRAVFTSVLSVMCWPAPSSSSWRSVATFLTSCTRFVRCFTPHYPITINTYQLEVNFDRENQFPPPPHKTRITLRKFFAGPIFHCRGHCTSIYPANSI